MADSYLSPSLTKDGINLLVKAMDGGSITFTKIALGDGTQSDKNTIHDLANKKLEIGISEAETREGYLVLTGYCNSSELNEAFYGKELGVYAQDADGNEYLYAYRYSESEVDFFPSKNSGRVIEIVFSVVVQVGAAENVSAILIDSDAFASKSEFKSHCNADNPHKITCTTIGASPQAHTHSANDVKSGILPVARGGTGADTYEKFVENMSKSGALGIPVFGTYTGDGTQGRTISLGFTPRAVILCDNYGNMHDDINGYIGGIAIGNHGCCSQRGSTSSAESYDDYYTTLMIVNNGFKVNYYSENNVYSNASGRTYRYIAFR